MLLSEHWMPNAFVDVMSSNDTLHNILFHCDGDALMTFNTMGVEKIFLFTLSRRSICQPLRYIVETLLDPDLDANQVCKAQPVAVESNLVFIVDLKHLKHPKDLLCDESGSWKCNGCRHTSLVVSDIDICGKEKPSNVDGSLYKVTKKYYLNKGSPDFHRLVVTMEGVIVHENSVVHAGRIIAGSNAIMYIGGSAALPPHEGKPR